MKNYVKTQSGEGKIYRAITNLKRAEALLGGLPLKFRTTEEQSQELRNILDEINQLQIKIKNLEKTGEQ